MGVRVPCAGPLLHKAIPQVRRQFRHDQNHVLAKRLLQKRRAARVLAGREFLRRGLFDGENNSSPEELCLSKIELLPYEKRQRRRRRHTIEAELCARNHL